MMLALLTTGMLALTFRIEHVSAGTIIVPDQYLTIQQAVDAAANGTTILVREGEYPESVLIENFADLHLIGIDGASNTVIKGRYKPG